MNCCLCEGEIESQLTLKGEVFWDKGHNPHPIRAGSDQRCCTDCNDNKVIPIRMMLITGAPNLYPNENEGEELSPEHYEALLRLMEDSRGEEEQD
ncbi:hypothetical protein CMI37_02825 [Candidatus Pacearchaeota archaeon]|nr:hypothetical protein [Candidatus Pacearchaeota archaeon]|tara:strand:- start:697 stop:981 length:285 start_codon:yes stop_codon:yes gene_type:complete